MIRLHNEVIELMVTTLDTLFSQDTRRVRKRSLHNVLQYIKTWYEEFNFIPNFIGPVSHFRPPRILIERFLLNRDWLNYLKPLSEVFSKLYPEASNLSNPWNIITYTSASLLNIIAQVLSGRYKSEKMRMNVFRVLPEGLANSLNELLKPLGIEIKAKVSAMHLLPLILCLDRTTIVGHNYADAVIRWLIILQSSREDVLMERLSRIREYIERVGIKEKDPMFQKVKDKIVSNYVPLLGTFVGLFNLGVVSVGSLYRNVAAIITLWERSPSERRYHFEPSPLNMLIQQLIINRQGANALIEVLDSIRFAYLITRIQKRIVEYLRDTIKNNNIAVLYEVLKRAISDELNKDPGSKFLAALVFGVSIDDVSYVLFTYMLQLATFYHYVIVLLQQEGIVNERMASLLIPVVANSSIKLRDLLRNLDLKVG